MPFLAWNKEKTMFVIFERGPDTSALLPFAVR